MKFKMLKLLFAMLWACSAFSADAYFGWLSKDTFGSLGGHTKSHRDWAYGAVLNAAQTKKPDTVLSIDELQAKRVLMDADEQILINNARRWESELISYLKRKLGSEELQILNRLNVRVVSDPGVVAKYFPGNSEIVVPSGLLVRSYYLASILEEAELVPSLQARAFRFAALRLVPSVAKQIENRAVSIMSLGLYENGSYSITDRKSYSEYLNNVHNFYNSVLAFSIVHEICHGLLKHGVSVKATREDLAKQETQADACAFEKLKDWQGFPFNPGSVFVALHFEFYEEIDDFSKKRTHPKLLCRFLDLGAQALGGGSAARQKVLSVLSEALREQDDFMIGIKKFAQEIDPTIQISDKDVLTVFSRNCP